MEGIVSVLGSPFSLMVRLLDIVKRYQKKKKTEARFLSAFEVEITAYLDIYRKAIQLSEQEVIPILLETGREITVHDMNKLLKALQPMPESAVR